MRLSLITLAIAILLALPAPGLAAPVSAPTLPATPATGYSPESWAAVAPLAAVWVAAPCHNGTLTESQFAAALNTLRARAFESARIGLAQELLRSQCISCAQLRQMLELFTFEQTRLDLARFAYPLVADPAHFSEVYSVFQFPASVAELRALTGQ
jgi:hypothetical protein